jgi:hypothetical protein
MKHLAPAIIVLSLAAMSGASGQSGTQAGGTGPGTTRTGVWQAPVGHRQPSQADVGSKENNISQQDLLDKELDRKIKNICRGC